MRIEETEEGHSEQLGFFLLKFGQVLNPAPFQGSPPEAQDTFEAGQSKLGSLFGSAAEHRGGDPVSGSDQVLFNAVACHLSAVSMRGETG